MRRGFGDVAAAREFLDAGVHHPLDAFGGLREGAAIILGHVERGSRITVHGDYDVDGVSATAVLVRALRTLGADVDWYLPSRIDDGYGLAMATVERLAARGTELLVTVDCAITAVEEVAAARAAGLDVVVTDHHTPRSDGRLPDAPIVHPGVGGYPCPELCAAGVAHLLARALLEGAGMDPGAAEADLDIVALATVADCVPLVGENRRLVRAGLRALASTRKPGLQALMDVARVDPSGVDASAIGFRLAPRINAAGRLHRADAGLELLLTADVERARAVAAELDAVNTERRDVETQILFAAEAQVAEFRAAAGGAEPAAYVLAGEGWHPGVIGIVASRIAERHHRPAVLIALDGEEGTGSGRSIPAFDLLGGLDAASVHLLRHGGHRAAAGCTIAASAVDAFRAAFVAHAEASLAPEDLVPVQRVDAVVPGDALALPLAEELQRLAPFGMANPEPSLLVPSALLDDPRPMGEGRHVSFTLAAGGARSRCVAFGRGSSLPAAPGEPVDAAVRLEVNRYNGAVEPRLVLRHAQPARPAPITVVGEPDPEAALLAELTADLDAPPPGGAGLGSAPSTAGGPAPAPATARLRRRPAPVTASRRRPSPGSAPRCSKTICAARPTASARRRSASSATPAAAASPACWAISSPAARPSSPSPPTPATVRGRCRVASAASTSRPGPRSSRTRAWPPAMRTWSRSTRPCTRRRARSPRRCPATAGSISRGATRSGRSPRACSRGSSTCGRRSPRPTARCGPPRAGRSPRTSSWTRRSAGRRSPPRSRAPAGSPARAPRRAACCACSRSWSSWSSRATTRSPSPSRRPRSARSSSGHPPSAPTRPGSRPGSPTSAARRAPPRPPPSQTRARGAAPPAAPGRVMAA